MVKLMKSLLLSKETIEKLISKNVIKISYFKQLF